MTNEELACSLSAYMSQKNVTLKKLSEKSGISVPELRDILDGKRKPRGLTLNKVANALGIDIEMLS